MYNSSLILTSDTCKSKFQTDGWIDKKVFQGSKSEENVSECTQICLSFFFF